MRKVKVGLWVGILALAILDVGLVADDTPPAPSVPSDRVCFEAENAKTITSYFVKRTTPFKDKRNRDSSGGYVEIEGRVHWSNGLKAGQTYYPGVVTYEVNIPSEGSYTFWARAWWGPDAGSSNSFWVQIGNQAEQLFGEDATYLVWEWRKLKQPVTLPAGKVTLTFKNHEDGIRIDQVFLAQGNLVPLGKMAVTPGALAHSEPDDKSTATH
jgi:hypothetical protein